jgi:hypothetical protein
MPKKTKAKPKPRAKIRHSRRANALMTQFIPLEASRTHRVAIHTGLADGLAEFEAHGRKLERAVQQRKNVEWSRRAQKLYAHLHSSGNLAAVTLFNQELRPLMTLPEVLETWDPNAKSKAHRKLVERATNLLRKMPSHAPEGSRSWEGAIADVIEALQGGDQ